MIYESPRFLYSGDQYLTIEIGDEMTLKANFKVIGLDQAIKEAKIKGIIETLPGWRSMLLSYDPLVVHTEDLISELKNISGRIHEVTEIASRLIRAATVNSSLFAIVGSRFPRTAIALRFFEPMTAPTPPLPAALCLSLIMELIRTCRSPAGPMQATLAALWVSDLTVSSVA